MFNNSPLCSVIRENNAEQHRVFTFKRELERIRNDNL